MSIFYSLSVAISALVRLTLLLLNTTCPVLANSVDLDQFLANSVDPDQLASKEANWSGSALFVIKSMNFYPDQVIWLAGN